MIHRSLKISLFLFLGIVISSLVILQSDYEDVLIIGSQSVNTKFGQQVHLKSDTFFIAEPKNSNGGNVYAYNGLSENAYDTIHIDVVGPGDDFGSAITSNTDLLFVGAPNHENSTASHGNGALFVFSLSGNDWVASDSLSISGSDTTTVKESLFGSSVSSTDTYMIVGAPGENDDKGGAYVFLFENDTVRLLNRLALTSNFDNAEFGQTVYIDSAFAYVTSPGHNNGEGAVFMYVRDVEDWLLHATIPTPANGVSFGMDLDVSGDNLIVSSLSSADNSGLVYQYDFQASDSTWIPADTLVAVSPESEAFFGQSVQIHDEIIAVGAPGMGSYGSVQFFYDHDSVWVPGVEFQGDSTSNFGAELSMSNNKLAVAAGGGVFGSATVFDISIPLITIDPEILEFGPLDAFQDSTLSFTIYNDGFVDLQVNNITGSSGFFVVDDPSFNIGKGESHEVRVTLTPIENDVFYSDSLVITHSGPTSPELIYVGQFPTFEAEFDSYSFAPKPAYTDIPDSVDFVVKNTGLADLVIDTVYFVNSQPNAPDDFEVFKDGRLILEPLTIVPDDSVIIQAVSVPRQLGKVEDYLLFRHNGLEGKTLINFEGEGTLPYAVLSKICDDNLICADTVMPSYVNVLFQITDQNGLGLPVFASDSLYLVEEDFNDASLNPESDVNIDRSNELNTRILTVLMLDNSVSINSDELDSLKKAAKSLINNILDGQEIAIYTFSEEITEIVDFTDDQELLLSKINSITTGSATTDLFGAAIHGAGLWEDKVSLNGLTLGNMVLLTDGKEEAQNFTLQEAIDAIGDKNVITVGVGADVGADTLQSLASNDGSIYLQAEDFEILIQTFIEAQDIIYRFANSRYWMVYISPRRNDAEHTLGISIIDNPNTNPASNEIEVTFYSTGFTSESPGIYVNRSIDDIDGIDTVAFILPGTSVTLNANTVFGQDNKIPLYEWSVDDDSLIIEPQSQVGFQDSSRVKLIRIGAFTKEYPILTVRDIENDFESSYPVILNEKPSVFDLISPENGSVVNNPLVVFSWDEALDPDNNEVIYDLTLFQESFDTTIFDISETQLTIDGEEFLLLNTQYDWNVVARDKYSERKSASTFGFFTPETFNPPPSNFNIVSPADNFTIDEKDIEFTWQVSSDPDELVFYYLIVFDNLNDVAFEQSGITGNSLTLNLEAFILNQSYTWYVQATDGTSFVNSDSVFTFITPLEIPLGLDDQVAQIYLSQNFPNPIISSSRIEYGAPFNSNIKIELMDLTGKSVALLLDKEHTAGDYEIQFDKSHLKRLSGGAIYLCEMTVSWGSGTHRIVRKVVIGE